MPQRGNAVEEIKRLDALLEYAVMHGDEAEAERKGGNLFYTSYYIVDGKGILWYNDTKFYLCGRVIGPEWFE